MSSPTTKKILIAVGVLLVLGAGAYFYFSGSAPISVGIIVPQGDEVVGQDILVLIDKLNSIKIDPGVFSKPLFTNLKDSSVPLSPELTGRLNPFALIGIEK